MTDLPPDVAAHIRADIANHGNLRRFVAFACRHPVGFIVFGALAALAVLALA